jgi:coenzyme F420-reducing hydrogenase delta subunit
MFNLASSEAPRFVEIAEEMTRTIVSLGPNPIKAARKSMAA